MILSRAFFLIIGLYCLSSWSSSGIALLMGVILAVVIGNPWANQTKILTHKLLSLAVMGLGAGMNLTVVAKVGLQGVGYTVLSIMLAFIFGTLLGKALNTTRDTSLLLTVGTAICGGSAIAAVAPVIRAKDHEVSASLGVVFVLNAVALFLFPWVGHHLQLSESQFGLWSALAIHDTSSVVGATLQYGSHALEVGTSVKLARALWIVPVTFSIGYFVVRRDLTADPSKRIQAKKPWFIFGFILIAALVTWIPALKVAGHYIEIGSKRLLVLTLFLIGTNLSRETLKMVGFRPFAQGFLLWAIMAMSSLFVIYENFIS